MVTPDIHEIIKKSLKVGKNLMFYLPRSIDIKELFDLLSEVTKQDIIFLDDIKVVGPDGQSRKLGQIAFQII